LACTVILGGANRVSIPSPPIPPSFLVKLHHRLPRRTDADDDDDWWWWRWWRHGRLWWWRKKVSKVSLSEISHLIKVHRPPPAAAVFCNIMDITVKVGPTSGTAGCWLSLLGGQKWKCSVNMWLVYVLPVVLQSAWDQSWRWHWHEKIEEVHAHF
jgi:hypothetical protein